MKQALLLIALTIAAMGDLCGTVNAQPGLLLADIKTPEFDQAARESLIERAKAAVRNLLIVDSRARFDDLKVKKSVDGTMGVCGTFNARGRGGLFTDHLFVFDGKSASFLIGSDAQNPTFLEIEYWGPMNRAFDEGYKRFC